MPITDAGQIKRITEMCGATIPARLVRELELRGDQPGSVTDLGVAYATLQCADLLENGAPGHPLLHAQPLAGDAGDPQRAAADGAVARRRAGVGPSSSRATRRRCSRAARSASARRRRRTTSAITAATAKTSAAPRSTSPAYQTPCRRQARRSCNAASPTIAIEPPSRSTARSRRAVGTRPSHMTTAAAESTIEISGGPSASAPGAPQLVAPTNDALTAAAAAPPAATARTPPGAGA